MTKDKWLDLIDKVKDKFGISHESKEPIATDIPGEKHIIEFQGPLGKIKLEWIEKPRVIDEKTVYSNRIGSHVKVEKIYDEDEKVSYLNAYQWDEASAEWQVMDANLFS